MRLFSYNELELRTYITKVQGQGYLHVTSNHCVSFWFLIIFHYTRFGRDKNNHYVFLYNDLDLAQLTLALHISFQ